MTGGGSLLKNIDKRICGSEKELYGDFIQSWLFNSRREARLCELSILQGTIEFAECPHEKIHLGGKSEVRKISADKLINYINEVSNDLYFSLDNQIPIYQWAIENIDMPDELFIEYQNKVETFSIKS